MYERAQHFGCSKSGIEAALKCLSISQKKILEHPKSCPLKRAKYLRKFNEYMAQGLAVVYTDESGFESGTLRPFGYVPISKPCIDSYNWPAKKRTNVIGALYEKILFALNYSEKNINGDVFYNWSRYTLILSLKTKCVTVMNNTNFRKRVKRLLNSRATDCYFYHPVALL